MESRVNFTSSLILEQHPMRNVKTKIKMQYYYLLEWFFDHLNPNELEKCRMAQYKKLLLKKDEQCRHCKIDTLLDSIIVCRYQRWRRKYRFWILCDLALITLDSDKIERAGKMIKNCITGQMQREQFNMLIRVLRGENLELQPFVNGLLRQYTDNVVFQKKKETRIIVTANMSAGKSTLINALVGKPVTRTAQEVCTGNVCYIYNKAFEDGHVHLQASELTFDADENELSNYEWKDTISIASYFRSIAGEIQNRICIIDTPGVNSVITREHRKISRRILMNEQYDILLYVLNANKLGTDEEILHLKWVYNNIISEKIVFVLNKLDNFRKGEDNIQESIDGVRRELENIGFAHPVICPFSAYFAYLLKRKQFGDTLTEDEEDEYNWYIKKFGKAEYDLSKYCESVAGYGDQFDTMSKRCGIYNLEKILYGGLV